MATAITTAICSLLFKKKAEGIVLWFNGLKLTTAQGIALGIIVTVLPYLLLIWAMDLGIIR